jgi:hypothetical protein
MHISVALAATASKNVDIVVTHQGDGGPAGSQHFAMLRLFQPKAYAHTNAGWNNPSVLAGPGSARTVVGTLGVLWKPMDGPFTGMWSLVNSEDSSLFTVDPTTGILSVGSRDLPVTASNNCSRYATVPCYRIVVTATQPGIDNSPFTDEMDVFIVDPATKPATITLDKSMARSGDTVTAKIANAPNGNGKDCVGLQLTMGGDHSYASAISSVNNYPSLVGHDGTFSFTVPPMASDWWLGLQVAVWRDCSNTVYASSSRIFVPPMAPPVLGASVSFPDPFTPDHTVTVCPSGCAYAKPSAAYAAARDAGWDNVLVKIKGTVYNDCVDMRSGFSGDAVGHIWFKGVGGDFAHLECVRGTNFHVVNGGGPKAGAQPMVVLENIEISDNGSKGILGAAAFTPYNNYLVGLRNAYIHDAFYQPIFMNAALCCDNVDQTIGPKHAYSFKAENSRVARSGGVGSTGHNMYIQNNDRFEFLYSITEASSGGHGLKSRAWLTNVNCSKFLHAYNPVTPSTGSFGGNTPNIDFSEGRQVTLSNSVIGEDGGTDFAKYAEDQEDSNYYHDMTKSDFSYTATGNLWIGDSGSPSVIMGPDNWHPQWDPWIPQVPPTGSTNETFVHAWGGTYQPGESPYYYRYRGDPNYLPLRQNNHAYALGELFVVQPNPPGIVFHVTQAGTSAASQPPEYATATDNGQGGQVTQPPAGTIIHDDTMIAQAEPANPYMPVSNISTFLDRASAGLPPLAGYVGYGDDPVRFPLPAACGKRPAGNVVVP